MRRSHEAEMRLKVLRQEGHQYFFFRDLICELKQRGQYIREPNNDSRTIFRHLASEGMASKMLIGART